MKRSLLPLIIAFLVISASAIDESAQLTGTVRDHFGAAIGKASVFIHWNTARAGGPPEPARWDVALSTDRTGTFSTQLTPGFYDVCVHARAFSPACQTVALGKGQTITYSPTLEVNQLITNEMQDSF